MATNNLCFGSLRSALCGTLEKKAPTKTTKRYRLFLPITWVGYDKNNKAKLVVIILRVNSKPKVPCSLKDIGFYFYFLTTDKIQPKIAHNKAESHTKRVGNLN